MSGKHFDNTMGLASPLRQAHFSMRGRVTTSFPHWIVTRASGGDRVVADYLHISPRYATYRMMIIWIKKCTSLDRLASVTRKDSLFNFRKLINVDMDNKMNLLHFWCESGLIRYNDRKIKTLNFTYFELKWDIYQYYK